MKLLIHLFELGCTMFVVSLLLGCVLAWLEYKKRVGWIVAILSIIGFIALAFWVKP